MTQSTGTIIYYDHDGGPILREVTADDVARLERSQDFYKSRVEELQKLLLKMPEPWATLCADIVANGYPRGWGAGADLPTGRSWQRWRDDAVNASSVREVTADDVARLEATVSELQHDLNYYMFGAGQDAAKIARLERLVEIAAAIMRAEPVGIPPRLVQAWRAAREVGQ